MFFNTRAVIEWFDDAERLLPWRAPGTTAWGVLLSEIMSQQTPVGRVAPIWEEWMRRWPTPADVAAAGKDDILRAWGSLGYPRRALRLWECAQAITEHGFPDTVEGLLELPGVGDYTARAVACFHFRHNVPVVDTNVRRVFARTVQGTFLTPPASKRELAAVAEILPEQDGPRFSAGLMELGALVCTASSPDCAACPLLQDCRWQQLGCPQPSAEDLAAKKKRVQKFTGTDRQVRGLIMKLLRESSAGATLAEIDVIWPDAAQRSRALAGLIEDGLADQVDGVFVLPR